MVRLVFLGWTSTNQGLNKCALLKDTTQWCPWGLTPSPPTPRSRVENSPTEPLRSCKYCFHQCAFVTIRIKKIQQMNSQINIQYNPFITLFLGSIEMDLGISELHYKGTILQRNYRKMTFKWSFSYNSFVKFHGKNTGEPQHDYVLSKSLLILSQFFKYPMKMK